MAAVRRFEELRMWQASRRLANLIYALTGQASFRDAALRNQMRRAAVSVMSNIAEGFGRGSNEEFIYFLYIAKGSLAELLSQLYLIFGPELYLARAISKRQEVLRGNSGATASLCGQDEDGGENKFSEEAEGDSVAGAGAAGDEGNRSGEQEERMSGYMVLGTRYKHKGRNERYKVRSEKFKVGE